MKLDPLRPFVLGLVGGAMASTGDPNSAIALYEKALAAVDSVFQEQGYLAAVEMTIKIDEEANDIHHLMIPYFGGLVNNDEQLRENPRAIALLKKMNLPLPQ